MNEEKSIFPLKEGVEYVTRDGDIVTIQYSDYKDIVHVIPTNIRLAEREWRSFLDTIQVFSNDGKVSRNRMSGKDIIARAEPLSPVQKVTTLKLNPGEYGIVRITEGGYVRLNSTKSKRDIEAAIKILQEILPVLEE